MGAYLSTPVREKISEDKSTDKLVCGVSSMQGWRVSQEDAHNYSPDYDTDLDTSFFAIYDGHGGAEVAQYASQNLPEFLRKMPDYKTDLTQALEDAFLQFDATIIHDDVLKELKAIAGVESDGEAEPDEEDEKEAAMLFEEADMPLDKLLERYTASGQQLGKLRQGQGSKVQSPAIRAKKESSAAKADDRTNNGGGGDAAKLNLAGELLVNGTDEKVKDGEVKVKDSEIKDKVKDGEIKMADSGGVVDNQTEVLDTKNVNKSEVSSKEAESASSDCNGCYEAAATTQGAGRSASSVSSTTSTEGSTGGSSVTEVSDPGSAGGSSSKSPDCSEPEAGSSLGGKRSKRKNVIPGEGEDESSCSDDSTDEWHSSDDEVLDGEGEPDSEDDDEDDEDDDDDDEAAMMGGTGEPGFDSGCTAVVAVLRGKQLYVANAGDSRCVVCRGGKALDMSIDHKPEDELEQTRINKAGGKVTYDGRVNGGLNLSRALGDHCYKKNEDLGAREQMITSLPDVKSITLDDNDEFMVLACDGIWNVMSSQDVVNMVHERLESNVTKLSSICEELFEMCLAPDTTGDGTGCDNMTCMVIDLSRLHGGKKTATAKRRGEDTEDQTDSKKAKTSDADVPESSS